MELRVTLNHGPLDIEIEGKNREEIQDEILGLAEFVEEHGDSIAQFEFPEEESDNTDNESTQTEVTGFAYNEAKETTGSSQKLKDSRYNQAAQETGVDQEVLSELINLPDDEEGMPSINTYHFNKGTEVLGNYRNQRQSQASALLLYIWDVCLGEKKIKFDRLDQALIASDIETEQRKNMHSAFSGDAGDWFESEGGSIWIIGSGKTHVRDLIEDLAEKMQE